MALFFGCQSPEDVFDAGNGSDTIPPTVPGGLSASEITDSSVTISWEASGDNVAVKNYVLYQNKVQIVTDSLTRYNVTGLSPQTIYTYTVRAVDRAGNISRFSPQITATTLKKEIATDSVERDTVAPPAPKNLTATNTTLTSTELNWNALADSTGVTAYRVYQDTLLLASVPDTTYLITSLTSGLTYNFSVSAIDAAENESALSNVVELMTMTEDTVQRDTIAPPRPIGLMVSDSSQTAVGLVWQAVADSAGAVEYRVYQDTTIITTTAETQYEVTDLLPVTEYTFFISAIDSVENESALSDPVVVITETLEIVEKDTIPPTVPVNLAANGVTQRTVALSWDSATDSVGVTNYTIYQNTNIIATTPETDYQVTGLSAGTSYGFTVSASDGAENESAQSDTLIVVTEAETDTIPPTVPMNVAADEVTQTTVNLSWDVSTDASGGVNYTVFQDGNAIANVTPTNYQVTGLSTGTAYSFTVSATDKALNESGVSEAVSVITEEAQATVDKVLVFTKTAEFRHTSIAKGISTITALGSANDFEVVQTENSGDFNSSNLQQYQLVVFLNTTGNVLNATQQSAFENYIQAGGSYMGVHAATDTEYDWRWYGQLVGAYFNGHPDIQQATVNTIDGNHPSTSHLPNNWVRTDEWYNFRDISSRIIPLLNLDENTYSGGTNGSTHPIAWYHEFDGGRSFYTGGGHADSAYDEPDFRQHLLGGIEWCLGR